MLTLTKDQATQFGYAIIFSEMLDKHSAPAIQEQFCKKVLPAVEIVPINPPSGNDVSGHIFKGGAKSIAPDADGLRPAVEFLKGTIASETKAPITIAAIGEGHWTDSDTARTKMLWTTFNDVTRGERLVVLERGMSSNRYRISVVKNTQPLVSEEQMMGGLKHYMLASETCRSIIMAAFVFLCVAGGHQDKRAKILVLIGENHLNDFVGAFEYFAVNSEAIPWVRKRARGYFTMTSLD